MAAFLTFFNAANIHSNGSVLVPSSSSAASLSASIAASSFSTACATPLFIYDAFAASVPSGVFRYSEYFSAPPGFPLYPASILFFSALIWSTVSVSFKTINCERTTL